MTTRRALGPTGLLATVKAAPVAPRQRSAPDPPPGRMMLREVRVAYQSALADNIADAPISAPETVARALMLVYDTERDPQENLFAVTLDSKNRVLSTLRVFRGTINSCTVSPRELLVAALLDGACGLIISHNHPSGDPAPSSDDLVFTKKVKDACHLVGIDLIDHIILGAAGRWVSLKERGVL